MSETTIAAPARAEADLADLVRHFEGLHLSAYRCPAGVPTIGYGHTKGVRIGQVITAAKAEEYLQADLAEARAQVDRLVTVPLAPHQAVALTSFVFNLGAGNFTSSTLLKRLNVGDAAGAAEQFGRWVYATVNGKKTQLPGLVSRRAAEVAMFQGAPWRTALAAPMAQAVEEAPAMKPLAKSRTVQAGGVGLTIAGVTAAAQQAREASGAVRDLVDCLPDLGLNLSAGWVAAAVLAAVVGYMLWRRRDDARKAVL
ncbi:lysozyme [Azospirillum picis]|uniref:Lysozyme n=1 Tax=Azospirillum picis TaxID=488438 RepID=A0ABU0MUP3_9PROT|nr:lysozyme [Azospirillum picis]MBP2303338.1 GH24 family phage-related lysozyme (muramidase) [Azospirillum picis]MDQ0537180.1 GH24 family phage-related lysozyme (muramidase) [Azospirillum picis]